jgi:hypothetical protein
MRVASGPFSLFELIDEYEAPFLNQQLHDFKAVFSRKRATGVFITPLQITRKEIKK